MSFFWPRLLFSTRESSPENWRYGWIAGYFRTVISLVLLLGMMLLDDRSVQIAGSPLVVFLVGVLVNAHFSGFGAGVFATVIAAVMADYWFLPPLHRLTLTNPLDAVHLGLFGLAALLLSWFSATWRQGMQALLREADMGIAASSYNRTQRQLQETNLQLRALIQASPLAITVFDRQGIVRLWNPAAERIFGWQSAEVIGKLLPTVPPEKQAEFAANIQLTLSGDRLNAVETWRQRKDGSPIALSIWTADFGEDMDDRSILSIMADLSDRKQAEAALKTSQEMLTSFFEADVIGILFGDVDGGILQANDAFLRMVGYSRDDLAAGKLGWITITPPEYLPLDAERIAEAQTRGACTPYEKEYIQKDGNRISVLVGYALIGELRRQSVAFILDLTDRKQLEQALQQQATELEQANRLKDEFLAVLSHELRTPLNSILGWATLLRSRTFDSATIAQALETIERNARLQAQLIGDILDVSNIIQGKLRLQPRPIELKPILESVLETMRPAAEAKQIRMELQARSQHDLVLGDSERLQQIFWNLISNAIKFTPEGGQVQIDLSLVQSPEQFKRDDVQIIVQDTGEGIPPEFLPYVFDRFRQADSTTTRRAGGLGLGLAIVRHLVELHGGTVEVMSSGAQQGSCFRVRLPLLRSIAETATS